MLKGLTRITISFRTIGSLDEATLARMWALYEPHHHMDRAEFLDKLLTLDEIALFTLRGDRTLVGFCGLRHRVIELSTGGRIATFYMGLAFVQRQWRSEGLIQRVAIRRMLGPSLSPRYQRVYFWADCLTYRPYLAMARNLREFYPSRTLATPDEVREVIATLGRDYYGDNFDVERGTVRKPLRRIRRHEALISAEDLRDPDIRFYLECNRDQARGDGLIAICPMGVKNLVHVVGRQLFKSRPPRPQVAPAMEPTMLVRYSTPGTVVVVGATRHAGRARTVVPIAAG